MRDSAGTWRPRGYLKLFRLGNCVMAALGALLASVICVGVNELSDFVAQIALSMAVVVSFTAAGNSLNDYYDREVDKVAHPERPIPSGVISPGAARAVAIGLFAAALVLGLFVNWQSVIIVVVSVAIIVGYERSLKAEGLAGNLAISWLTGALFLFGGAAVGKLELAWILAALAFLATLGREIVKDIQDLEGDKGSRRTLPMRVGVRNAGFAGSTAFFGAVALSPLPYLLKLLSIWYVPVVAAADGIFIYCALIHFQDPGKGQKVAKLGMLVALLAFFLGGVL
jgi:geranylgeranylglycerol-phosphate geranylgeranyltransferase